jgi:hypothetical protein
MFELYPPLLMFSGILLLVMAALPWQSGGARVVSALFGVGFLGYGFYLEFIFTGGTYIVFYYAFIVPVLMIVQTVKGYQAYQRGKAAAQQPIAQQQPPMGYPPQPFPAGPPPQYPGAPPQQYQPQPYPQQPYPPQNPVQHQ